MWIPSSWIRAVIWAKRRVERRAWGKEAKVEVEALVGLVVLMWW